MYLQKTRLKISLDIDGTIFDWEEYFHKNFGIITDNKKITKIVRDKLTKNKSFWLNQPLINFPNFVPCMYCTARIISKNLTRKQLEINKLPTAPVYQVPGYSISKVPRIKMGGCNLHIDDSLKVFIDCNLNGVPCLLMDNPSNRDWGPIGRIYSLSIDEIESSYYLFKDTAFSYFKELVNDYRN